MLSLRYALRMVLAAFAAGLASCASTPHGPLVETPEAKARASWNYALINAYNGEPAGELRYPSALKGGWGLLADTLINRTTYNYPEPEYPFPLQAGQRWTEDTQVTADGKTVAATVRGQALEWERVKVPAGEFDALKIRRQIYLQDHEWWRLGTHVFEVEWYAPAIGQIVRRDTRSEYVDIARGRDPMSGNVIRGDWNIVELVSYQRDGQAGSTGKPRNP